MNIRLTFGLVFPIMVVLVVTMSCTPQKTEWQGTIEEVDGIKMVHNFYSKHNKIYMPIEFIEDLSIGVEAGEEEYMFNYPADIDADLEGNIYILDYRDCLVKKYDEKGKHLTTFGRRGQGPGEFAAPISFCVSLEDKIYVIDSMSNKVEVYSTEGNYLETIKTEFADRVLVDGSEELIIGGRIWSEDVYRVVKLNPKSNETLELYTQEQVGTSRIMDDEFVFDIPYFVRWAINSSSNVYVGTVDKYEICIISPGASTLFRFDLEYQLIPVSGKEKRKITEILDGLADKVGSRISRDVSFFYPAFKSISIDEKDRIWIEHYEPVWLNEPREKTTFDIFSAEGKYLFTTKIKGYLYPKLVFKNGYIYTLIMGELGYKRAIRFKVIEN